MLSGSVPSPCEHMFVPRHRPAEEFEATLALSREGLSDSEVSRITGIPCRTINGWRRGARRNQPLANNWDGWRPPCDVTYCYLLGIYLGDGHIAIPNGKAPFLRVAHDSAYSRIAGEIANALQLTFPGRKVLTLDYMKGNCINLQLSHPALPYAFPQHGPGRKHERKIELVPWQLELTRAYPERLLRGLIHSDGSRCINRFDTKLPSGRVATYEYPRYFFTNYSADIRGIFTDHCELLGIRWTRSNPRNISISHRDSVALMDSFIGPKE